jgi:alpha-galactosidase
MPKKQKIVLIGAGSLQFGLSCVGNILNSQILKGSKICLHDINTKNLELTYQACQSVIDEKKLDFSLEYTISRPDALNNATFVINSIEVPPRFELLEMDYRIPQQFGNKQVTGENGGPGGLFHSLRVIPPILDICRDIKKICPNAFLINYSNPLSRICLAIKREFPSLKFVGLCHEYQHFMPILQKILNTPISNLDIKAGGLNHFGVILSIKYRDIGQDAYPDIYKRAPEILRSIEHGPYLDNGYNLTAFILETYKYLPYTSDSHYGEYIHWAWEKSDISAIRRFVRDYENFLDFEFKKLKRFIKKGKCAKIVRANEEREIQIVEGILTDANYEEPSVNIPNDRIFTNLPQDLIVECPAIVNKNGINGIELGEYPKGLAALIRTQAAIQDLVVEAILKKSKDLALQALLADPVVETYWQAKNIFKELMNQEQDYIQIQLE